MLLGNNFCPTECPSYYQPLLHAVGTTSTFLNILGIWLIFFKTTQTTKYRWCQFYLQIFSFLTEFDLSLVNPAYFYFPMIGGINCGPTKVIQARFGISSHFCMVFFALFFSMQIPAIFICFCFRLHAVSKISTISTPLSRCFMWFSILVIHVFPLILSVSFYYSGLSKSQMIDSLAMKYPDCLRSLDDFTFDLYDHELNPNFILFLILLTIFIMMACSSGTFLALKIYQKLNKYRSIMSQKTYELHKTALKTLTAQFLAPSIFLGIPVFIIYFVVVEQNAELHVLASLTPCLISAHSIVSVGAMIGTTPSFRSFIVQKFTINLRKESIRSTSQRSKVPTVF